MNFSEILGHDSLKKKITELARMHKLAHAVLFHGKKGNGAMPLALATAKYLLCNDQQESEACGDCPSCSSVDKLIHPDLFLSFPVFNTQSNKKNSCKDFIQSFREFISTHPYSDASHWIQSCTKENKQGNIPAEECNEILHKMNMRPLLGGVKILIIWYAEFLGNNGNKLLKLIEEPPKNTFIFFVVEDLNQVLLTIQSRAQLFALKPYSFAEIENKLLEQGIEMEQAKKIALLSDGNVDFALRERTETDEDYYSILRHWLNGLFTDNVIAMHQWVNELDKLPKESTKAFFHYANSIFEQAMRYPYVALDQLPLNDKEKNLVKGLVTKQFDASKLEKMNRLCEDAMYHLERNTYKKLLIYQTSLKAQEVLVN